MTVTTNRERRWIVLSQDGRHTTLGRDSDPSEEEILRSADALRAMGLGGWLAVLEGVYYGKGSVTLMEVRELEPSPVPWTEAVLAFQGKRVQTLSPPGPV